MSDYLRSGWDFVARHKKKFIALGLISGASIGGYYYAKRLLKQGIEQLEKMGEDMRDRLLDQGYRASELQRIHAECDSTIDTFLPPMRRRLFELTDPRPVTIRIKEYRRDRTAAKNRGEETSASTNQFGDQLWDELKTVSLTRLVASVYALSLLSLLMRLQLYVVGRYSLQETLELRSKNKGLAESECEKPILTADIREAFMFLATDQLINSGDGMKLLVQRIHDCVMSETSSWHMGTHATVTKSDIHEMLAKVRSAIEQRTVPCVKPGTVVVDTAEAVFENPNALGDGSRKWLVQCLLGKNAGKDLEDASELKALTKKQNKLLKEMLNETMDIIESPLFASALDGSISSMFSQLGEYISDMTLAGVQSTGDGDENEEPKYLLAKVVVNLKQSAADVLHCTAGEANTDDNTVEVKEDSVAQPNKFVTATGLDDSVKEMCELVFNADEPETEDPFGLGAALGGNMSKELMEAFSPEDMEEISNLLGGLGMEGGDGPNLMQMLSSFGQMAEGGPPGGGDEQALANMLQSMMAQESQQGSAVEEISRSS